MSWRSPGAKIFAPRSFNHSTTSSSSSWCSRAHHNTLPPPPWTLWVLVRAFISAPCLRRASITSTEPARAASFKSKARDMSQKVTRFGKQANKPQAPNYLHVLPSNHWHRDDLPASVCLSTDGLRFLYQRARLPCGCQWLQRSQNDAICIHRGSAGANSFLPRNLPSQTVKKRKYYIIWVYVGLQPKERKRTHLELHTGEDRVR